MKTVFRPRFWLDLEEGVAYLAASSSVETARIWHEAVMAAVARVEKRPEILRIKHGMMDIPSLFAPERSAPER